MLKKIGNSEKKLEKIEKKNPKKLEKIIEK